MELNVAIDKMDSHFHDVSHNERLIDAWSELKVFVSHKQPKPGALMLTQIAGEMEVHAENVNVTVSPATKAVIKSWARQLRALA